MSMKTNLSGRVRNTPLSLHHGLLPLFEAVINAIHSYEEAGLAMDQATITVDILRNPQIQLPDPDTKKRGREATGDITGFKITDFGIGFNDANMESFNTLDTDYKAVKGCRGVGRLLWLKAFDRVNITSVFDVDGGSKSRSFVFSVPKGVFNEKDEDLKQKSTRKTIVHLDGFKTKYRQASLKTAQSIADNLFEHCLWYFVRAGGCPKITVNDNDEIIDLDDIYSSHMISSSAPESMKVKGVGFELTHIKLRASTSSSHSIVFCASNRPVLEEGISGKVAGLFGKLKDDAGEFIYLCYVSSPYLDERVRPERTGFEIEEEIEGLLSQAELSLNEIKRNVIDLVGNYLEDYLEENKQLGRNRVEKFVSNEGHRYRPILSRIDDEKLIVDPTISSKELEMILHKELFEIERQLLDCGHDLLGPRDNETQAEYRKRIHDYLKTVEDVKMSDLAAYVSHRRVILDLLGKALERDSEGKYVIEEFIHELIMPLRKESNEIRLESCNLWLIDESLAFHDFLASDKTLKSMSITSSDETVEPDICALNVIDEPILFSESKDLPLASIVVVEIKRPMRNDAAQGEDRDPIEQALGYLRRIQEGKVQTASGRPIPQSDNMPGYCYVICDLTQSIKDRCMVHGLTVTNDHLGYFGYNSNFKAYIEVISFQRLLNDAKKRNKAFFDRLGLPTK